MASVTRVYVAGPYTKGDVVVNVRNAVEAATWLLARGYAPYVPHLTHFWHYLTPYPYETWMALDLAWLRVSEVVLRLPGESAGADREVAEARMWGIPVVYTVEDVTNVP